MSSEEKQTESASFFQELGSFMKPYSGKYAFSVALSILSVAASLAAYGFVGSIAGKLFSADCHWETVLVPAAAAVICKILHALLLNVSTWISHRAAYLTLRDIRNAAAAKLMRLPVGYFEENGSGRLKTILVDHVEGMEKTQIFSSLGMTIAPFSLFPVLIAGLIFYGNHTLEAGTLFLMVLLTFGIFGPLMNAMAYFDQLAAMGTNAKEIRDVLDSPELKRGSEAWSAGSEPDIAFSNVTFSYAAGNGPALKGISLRVPAGTMLALVGPSGSGKSTIAKLLAVKERAAGNRIIRG